MRSLEIDKLKSDICDVLELDIEPSNLDDNTDIVNDLELDSLDIVDLMIGLEEIYDIELEEFSINEIKTIKDLNQLINSLLKTLSGSN
ncbi:acyl carrier protein [Oceanobacillus sp. J11TS1]|uniref:acyl carrier protein n=1 Tax=Oceanobacillus sp. J11TS1 TaxID=2807191 RepID=UPI001AFE8CEF|nr:phosphopantetheine-binding protein [Oceanobacillus sp. J11TS1]GIO25026.1 hypothetical protein J11TS1_36070 [Oceanobacillus sp. J11TS1]